MSAGICIMNKNAVALAADSAVTVGPHLAIHNSANKLFALSKVAPVGVIVYANAEFMEVPIEILIKQYKSSLQNKKFSTLEEYVENFLEFLISNKDLFRFGINEKKFVRNVYVDLLNGLGIDYQNELQNIITIVQRELTADELSAAQQNAINTTKNLINTCPLLDNFDVTQYIKETYFEEIKNYISSKFPWILEPTLSELTSDICHFYNKNFFRSGYVGLAFAGYGENDIFPKMIHLHMSGVINEKVRYFQKELVSINEERTATITPLAQTDVMQTFLFGINDSFIGDIEKEIPLQIKNRFLNIDDAFFSTGKKVEVQQKLNDMTSLIVQQIIRKAQEAYLFPITNSVATLPIEELALLAESMINITSLRRKVALDKNIGTVGGPIDVAIISKSDGFIWLKRKHYFDHSYNPQYFYSHYMLTKGGTDD